MANLLTLLRLLLVYVLVTSAVQPAGPWQLWNAPLLLLIIALDGVDGWVARRFNETSRFGSVFDVVADRIVENVLWIVLAHVGLVPLWVSIVFITRGLLVDGLRYREVAEHGTPFGMMRTRLGRALVAGRFMRAFYGVVKAAAFGWLFLIQPLPAVYPAVWAAWGGPMSAIGDVLVALAVAVCLLRGVPVLAETLLAEGVLPRPARPVRPKQASKWLRTAR